MLRIYHGLQRGFEVFAISSACTFVRLLLLYIATRYQAGIPVLLLCSVIENATDRALAMASTRTQRAISAYWLGAGDQN